MGGDHPETLLVLVVLEDAGPNGISDPLAIGTQFWLSDVADLEIVIDADVARSGGGGLRRWFLGVSEKRREE